jgi:ribosomal protein L5
MDWIVEDWEYPNDHIYAMERHHDMQLEWQQWEEEQERKKRLPAIIKVVTPILVDEAECNTRTVRRAHQTRL